MANIEFKLASGRRVGLTAHGQPYGRKMVVFCHPAPGSSRFDPDPRATGYRDVHLLGLDRPGYGSSDPLPSGTWPRIATYASDIAEYLHACANSARDLGSREFDSVSVVGWEAGGRVALALAAAHPHLVDRVVVFGTPAPDDAIPWMDPELAETTRKLAQRGPDEAIDAFAELFEKQMGALVPRHGSEADGLELLALSAADAGALASPGLADRLTDMLRDAFRQGAKGLAADVLSFAVRDWGFDPAHVRAQTLLLYGAEDPVIGPDHADWYHGRIPHSVVEAVPGAGHLAIVPGWERALDFVAGDD
jgi:pimeloyl-ACP methyl ester carboxylesterase